MRSVLTALQDKYLDQATFRFYELDPAVPLTDQAPARDFGIDGHPFTAIIDSKGHIVKSWYGVVDDTEILAALRTAGMQRN